MCPQHRAVSAAAAHPQGGIGPTSKGGQERANLLQKVARTRARTHTHTIAPAHAPRRRRVQTAASWGVRGRLIYLTLRRRFPRNPLAPLYYQNRIICFLLASGATGHMNYDKSEGRPQPGVCDPGTVVA